MTQQTLRDSKRATEIAGSHSLNQSEQYAVIRAEEIEFTPPRPRTAAGVCEVDHHVRSARFDVAAQEAPDFGMSQPRALTVANHNLRAVVHQPHWPRLGRSGPTKTRHPSEASRR